MDKMMSERAVRKPRSKEIVSAAGALLFANAVYAAEIPKDADFATGIKMMHADAFSSGSERARTFLLANGKTHWVEEKVGELGRVVTSRDEHPKILIGSGMMGGAEATECSIHVHNLGSAVHARMITQDESDKVSRGEIAASFAPSGTCINSAGT